MTHQTCEDWLDLERVLSPSLTLSLSGLSVQELIHIHEAVETLKRVAEGLTSQPRFMDENRFTGAGRAINDVCDMLDCQERQIFNQLNTTRPKDDDERDKKAMKLIECAAKYGEALPDVTALAARLSARVVQ